MKTYIIITPFFPTPNQFYGVYIYDQVKALQRCGKNVLVLRPYNYIKDTVPADYEIDGIKVYHFPTIQMPSYILNGLTDFIDVLLFKRFIKHINSKYSDVEAIHCHTLSCATYGIEFKKQYPNAVSIIQHHDLDPYTIRNGRFANCKWNLYYKAHKAIKKFSKFDVHVSVSNRVEENLCTFPGISHREHFNEYINLLNKLGTKVKSPVIKKSIVVYNGIDFSKFRPIPEIKKDNSIYKIGCIGNYVNIKNHRLLIEATSILIQRGYNNIRLSLVGNNPPDAFEDIKYFVMERNLQKYIEFLPPFAHSELSKFYNSLNLFVLPSEFEGLGCVYLESYACGTPFVGVKDQGIDDLIPTEDKEKWLISKINAEELANKIEQIMVNNYIQHISVDIDINHIIKDYLASINLL